MTQTICSHLLTTKTRNFGQEALSYKKNGNWIKVSWSEYYSNIEKISAGLSELGLKSGERVALISNTRPEWCFFDLAIMGGGGITVPIYQSSMAEEMHFILNDSESIILICENLAMVHKWNSISAKCPAVKKVVVIDPEGVKDANVITMEKLMEIGQKKLSSQPDCFKNSCNAVKISDMATICYTSGTTGMPKGVVLSHEQIMSEVVDVFKVIEITPADKSITFLPFAHILARVEHLAHCYLGFSMGYAESVDKVRDNLAEVRPTFMIAVPRIFEKIYNGMISQAEASPVKKKIFHWAIGVGKIVSQSKIENKSLPYTTTLQYQLAKKLVFDKLAARLGGRVRFALSGGAPLSAEIGKFFHAANLLVLEGYGLTETTAAVFVNTPYKYKFGTVGLPIGDTEVKIAADGEILIRSKKVMKGYYKNDQATKDVLSADGWFATGDIGELSPDNFLKITDRKKDLIKTAGGKYVAPQKLENLLKLNRYIANVLIHGDKKKYIVALVTLNFDEVLKFAEANGLPKDRDALAKDAKVKQLIREGITEVNSQLAGFESIKNFDIIPGEFTVDSGEITPSLKVKRKFCDQKFAAQIANLYGAD